MVRDMNCELSIKLSVLRVPLGLSIAESVKRKTTLQRYIVGDRGRGFESPNVVARD